MNPIEDARRKAEKEQSVKDIVDAIIRIDYILYQKPSPRGVCAAVARDIKSHYDYNDGKPEMQILSDLIDQMEQKNISTTHGEIFGR